MILSKGAYFGLKDRVRVLDDYLVTLTYYQDQHKIPHHAHESAYASIVLRGKYLEKRKSSSEGTEVGTSKVVFRQMGYEHANEFSNTGGVCLNIELNDESKDKLGLFSLLFKEYHTTPPTLEIAKVVNALLAGYRDDEINCLIGEFFASFLLQTQGVRDSVVVNKAVDFISENFHRSLSLEEIAAFANVHPVYLARAFKNKMNSTIGDFIRSKRITSAYFDLFNAESTLTNTAFSTGFFDQAHFIKSFKGSFNQTPTQSKNLQKLI
ncbi:MAG: helix-turn-helix domain-containing protein [Ekhidna sp.]